MWLPKPSNGERKAGGGGGGGERGNGLVAVAVDKDKGSQYALKWAIENPIFKSQTVILIHVVHQPTSASGTSSPHPTSLKKLKAPSFDCCDFTFTKVTLVMVLGDWWFWFIPIFYAVKPGLSF